MNRSTHFHNRLFFAVVLTCEKRLTWISNNFRKKEAASALTGGLLLLGALGVLGLLQTLLHLAGSQSLLPLTCRHLLGASLSHLSDSSHSSLPGMQLKGMIFFSSSCVCPLGRSWMLGHQLGCCRGFVDRDVDPPYLPPPPPPPLFGVMS